MDRKYKVGGYVKLAKLWERSKDVAVAYHSAYYAERFRDDAEKRLVGVYIDITGNKEIYKRPEMVHWENKDKICSSFSSRAFSGVIFEAMNWKWSCRYQCRGICRGEENARFLIFELDESRILIGKNQYEQIEGRSMDLKCRLYRSKWIQSIAASDMSSGRIMNLLVTIPAESRRMNVGKDVIRVLGSPTYICVLQRKEELTAASPPDVKIGTKKFSKKAKK